MFERFTHEARTVVMVAVTTAEEQSHRRIGTLHLLLGVLQDEGSCGYRTLSDVGVDLAALRCEATERLDAAYSERRALATIGIDLDEVRNSVEATFGRGALPGRATRRGHRPFTTAAKQVLERSLREALERSERHIGSEHILLALTRVGDRATRGCLAETGATRAALSTVLRHRHAG